MLETIITNIIVYLIIGAVLSVIFSAKNTESKNDGTIEFKFTKTIIATFVIGIILFGVCTVGSTMAMNNRNDPGNLFVVILFLVFTIIDFLSLLYIGRKNIVYQNGIFISSGLFEKKNLRISDIQTVTESSDGMKLIFNDKSKIKIYTLMTNYSELKNILDQHKIVYKDNQGTIKPKGW